MNTDLASIPLAGKARYRSLRRGENRRSGQKKNTIQARLRKVTSILGDKAEGTFFWIGFACLQRAGGQAIERSRPKFTSTEQVLAYERADFPQVPHH